MRAIVLAVFMLAGSVTAGYSATPGSAGGPSPILPGASEAIGVSLTGEPNGLPNSSLGVILVAMSGDPTKRTCKEMKAAADAGRLSDLDAGLFYAHGMWMGDRCMRPDYVKSFTLLRKAHSYSNMQSILNNIVLKARSGSASAQWTLRKLKSLGFIVLKNGPDTFDAMVGN